MTLESYARLLAHLAARRGTPTEEILATLGISADDLRASEPDLRAQLSTCYRDRKGVAAMKFAVALGDELAHLSLLAPGPADAPTHPLAEPDKALPSFLQPAAFPSTAPVAPPPVNLPGARERPAPIAALPLAAPPPELPPVQRAPAHLSGTSDTNLSAIVAAVQRGALPFAASRSPSPASMPGPAKPPLPAAGAGGTLSMEAVSDEVDLQRHPLELYAAITGALARGEPREQVLAAHQLAPELFDRLGKAWAARFAEDPQLRARFQDLAKQAVNRGR